MDEVKERIEQLRKAGWTIQALADELNVHRTSIHEWESGAHAPAHSGLVLAAFDALLDRKPPPKRRYPEGHYMQRAKAERESQQRERAQVLYMRGWSSRCLENRHRWPESQGYK